MTILSDDELDALVRAADPVDEHLVHRVAASSAATGLRAGIGEPVVLARVGRRVLRPRTLAVAAATAAAVLTAAIVTVDTAHGPSVGTAHRPSNGAHSGSAPIRTQSIELVRFAQRSPRFLLGAAGRPMTRVDEYDPLNGEMDFGSREKEVEVTWVEGAHAKDSQKRDLFADGYAKIDGTRAYIGHSHPSPTSTWFTAIWSVGNQTMRAGGRFASRAEFVATLATLHRVDVDTWLAALPASAIPPSIRTATVKAMLRDVPQPPGFDEGALFDSPNVSDRYQLGGEVVSAVSCAWLSRWAHGSAAERRHAAEAMATSRGWAILLEMDREGDYPGGVWDLADAMNGKPTSGIKPGYSLEWWAKGTLGC